jgi:hypothetical protein
MIQDAGPAGLERRRAMTSTSAPRGGKFRDILFASSLAITATQSWLPGVNGLSPADDPTSPYFLGQLAPPSWQGRPSAIPGRGE